MAALPISPFVLEVFTLNDDDLILLDQCPTDEDKYIYIVDKLFPLIENDKKSDEIYGWLRKIFGCVAKSSFVHDDDYITEMLIKYNVEIIIREFSKINPSSHKMAGLLLTVLFIGSLQPHQITPDILDDINLRTVKVSHSGTVFVIKTILPKKELYPFINTLMSIYQDGAHSNDVDNGVVHSTPFLDPVVESLVYKWLDKNQPQTTIKSYAKE
jgi:hypothetical protein